MFDQTLSSYWMLSSLFAFCLDAIVYHTVYIFVRSIGEFMLLVAAGTDGSTLPASINAKRRKPTVCGCLRPITVH